MMPSKPLLQQGWARALFFVVCFTILMILIASLANWKEKSLLFYLSSSVLLSIATVYVFRTLVDKQSLVSLGLPLKNNLSHAAAGFFLAILLLGTGSLLLVVNNNLHWIDIAFNASQLFVGSVSMFLVAFSEELVFRGYILNNLMQSTNKWIALVLSAMLFAFFHSNNPGITPVAILNVFIAGVLLGINYIYTKNLWFAILFHFGWNFYQGSILGFKVSGVNIQSLLEQELTGQALLTGGVFGFEGSVIDGALSIVAIMMLVWVYRKRYKV